MHSQRSCRNSSWKCHNRGICYICATRACIGGAVHSLSLQLLKRRSHFLKRNNFQIAIHPREAFEGQVLSKSSNSSGGFQHGQGFNYRLPTCPDAVIDIEDYSYNFGDTSSSGAAAAASNMIGATTNPANTVGWLLSSSTTSQIVRMVATTGAAMALM